MYLKPFDQLLARVRNMDYFLAHRVELTWNLDAEVKQLNFAISVDNNDWRSTERNNSTNFNSFILENTR